MFNATGFPAQAMSSQYGTGYPATINNYYWGGAGAQSGSQSGSLGLDYQSLLPKQQCFCWPPINPEPPDNDWLIPPWGGGSTGGRSSSGGMSDAMLTIVTLLLTTLLGGDGGGLFGSTNTEDNTVSTMADTTDTTASTTAETDTANTTTDTSASGNSEEDARLASLEEQGL